MYLTPGEKCVLNGHVEVIACVEKHTVSIGSRISQLLFLL